MIFTCIIQTVPTCATGLYLSPVLQTRQGVDVDHEALVFQCNGLKLAAAEAAAALSEEMASAAAEIGSSTGPTDVDPSPSLAFQLSSRPAATKKIFLDFQGGTVTGQHSLYAPTCRQHITCMHAPFVFVGEHPQKVAPIRWFGGFMASIAVGRC